MSPHYIKFKERIASSSKEQKSGFTQIARKRFKKLLTLIIPEANPEFESKIEEVAEWLLEFDAESPYPTREIGLDSCGNVLMIMPWKDNYGYWTDNEMTYEDFKQYSEVFNINAEEFNQLWEKFASTSK